MTEMLAQHRENINKWGHQRIYLLQIATMEELGEVSRTLLERYSKEAIQEEIIHTMALLLEMALGVEREEQWDG